MHETGKKTRLLRHNTMLPGSTFAIDGICRSDQNSRRHAPKIYFFTLLSLSSYRGGSFHPFLSPSLRSTSRTPYPSRPLPIFSILSRSLLLCARTAQPTRAHSSTWLAGFTYARKRREPTPGIPVAWHLPLSIPLGRTSWYKGRERAMKKRETTTEEWGNNYMKKKNGKVSYEDKER